MPTNLYKRAAHEDVVFVPVARGMLDELATWGPSVQVRIEPDPRGHPLVRQLVFRRAEALASTPAPPAPMTDGQRRAYHAKLNAIAATTGATKAAVRAGALAEASDRFGREISSSTELSSGEASWLLDRLDAQLELTGAAT